jgi:hypothetical protein
MAALLLGTVLSDCDFPWPAEKDGSRSSASDSKQLGFFSHGMGKRHLKPRLRHCQAISLAASGPAELIYLSSAKPLIRRHVFIEALIQESSKDSELSDIRCLATPFRFEVLGTIPSTVKDFWLIQVTDGLRAPLTLATFAISIFFLSVLRQP